MRGMKTEAPLEAWQGDLDWLGASKRCLADLFQILVGDEGHNLQHILHKNQDREGDHIGDEHEGHRVAKSANSDGSLVLNDDEQLSRKGSMSVGIWSSMRKSLGHKFP